MHPPNNDNIPVPQNQRTPIVDILRGWALFSVVIMNYATIYQWNNHSTETKANSFHSLIENTTEVILGSKGWTLLAILFGFGFSAFLKNISQGGQPKYALFTQRMLWLLVFAILNTAFFGGDILHDYALMGFLLLLFHNLSARSLFIVGTSILILTPLLQSYIGSLHLLFSRKDRDLFYQLYEKNTFFGHIKANFFMRYKWMLRLSYSIVFHLVQMGCFLIGVSLHRSNCHLQINSNQRLLKYTFWMSLVFAVFLYFLQYFIAKNHWSFNNYYNLYYPQILSIMIATTTGVVWLYISGKSKNGFSALQAIGKMTLTNYIAQNIISFVLLICLKPNWALQWYLLLGLTVYSLQIIFSNWWLKKYNYGIMEWLWRCLSYRKMFRLKK